MTTKQILEKMRPVKPMSLSRLYFHFGKLKIKPLGARQRPQQYPDDTPDRIKQRLGFKILGRANDHTNGKARR